MHPTLTYFSHGTLELEHRRRFWKRYAPRRRTCFLSSSLRSNVWRTAWVLLRCWSNLPQFCALNHLWFFNDFLGLWAGYRNAAGLISRSAAAEASWFKNDCITFQSRWRNFSCLSLNMFKLPCTSCAMLLWLWRDKIAIEMDFIWAHLVWSMLLESP